MIILTSFHDDARVSKDVLSVHPQSMPSAPGASFVMKAITFDRVVSLT